MSSVQTVSGKSSIQNTTSQNIWGKSNILSNVFVQTRKRNFTIYKGTTFSINFTVFGDNGQPFDLTGWVSLGWLAKSYYGDGTTLSALSMSFVGDPTLGVMNAYISNFDSVNLDVARYVYNIDIFQGGEYSSTQYRVLEGTILVEPGLNNT